MIQVAVVMGILLAIVLLVLLATYNSLTQLRQHVRAAWAEMDQQLKNRYELIPVLVASVQSIGGEPANKLPAITAARNQAAVAFNPAQLAVAESALTLAIRDLLTAAGDDAAVNSDPRFAEIRLKLLESEERIGKVCRCYNDRVENLNYSLRSFPTAVTANLIGVEPQQTFELPTRTGK